MNSKSTFLRTAVLATIGFLGNALSSSAHAGLPQEMDKMFGSMVNVTAPRAYIGQRRGVLSAGSLTVRNKVTNTNIISFSPPSISAGCGGIDFFAGSFSFINGEQFQELLRNVASNALGYAFELALSSMCPDCTSIINELQDKIQKINQYMGNSCQLAKGLVNMSPLGAMAREKRAGAGTAAANAGGTTDLFSALFSTSGKNPESIAADMGLQEQFTGNVVWASLKRSNVHTWYTHGDDALLRALMSLTGTIIVRYEAGGTGGGSYKYEYKAPTLSVRDLLHGGTRAEVWNCADGSAENQCKQMTRVTTVIEGMRGRVFNILAGGAGNVGLIEKFARNISDLSTREKAFVQNASTPIMAMIRNLAFEKEAAVGIANRASDAIALEMTMALIDAMVKSVENAVSSHGDIEHSEFAKRIIAVKDDIARERGQIADNLAGLASLTMMYSQARKSLPPKHTQLATGGR